MAPEKPLTTTDQKQQNPPFEGETVQQVLKNILAALKDRQKTDRRTGFKYHLFTY